PSFSRSEEKEDHMRIRKLISLIALSTACGSSEDQSPNDPKITAPTRDDSTPAAETTTPEADVKKILDARVVNYGEALRTASFKLRDRLPDLSEIRQIENGADDAAKKVVYEKLVDEMIASPDF